MKSRAYWNVSNQTFLRCGKFYVANEWNVFSHDSFLFICLGSDVLVFFFFNCNDSFQEFYHFLLLLVLLFKTCHHSSDLSINTFPLMQSSVNLLVCLPWCLLKTGLINDLCVFALDNYSILIQTCLACDDANQKFM